MSTLQNTPHRNPIRARPGTILVALTALITIGLALLILTPTGHRATAPTTGSTAHEAALPAQTLQTLGCFRDPATHALTCSHATQIPAVTAAPAGYFRDPATHQLVRLPATPRPAGQHPANHSRGRIIP